MDEPVITHIELSYLGDGGVIVSTNLIGDPMRPTLTVTITSPTAELAATALEVRDQLRPHLVAAARAAIPPEGPASNR